MKNSTSLRRRNQFMLFTMTVGLFLFYFICIIRNLNYPMTTSTVFLSLSVALSVLFYFKCIPEKWMAGLIILLLNGSSVGIIINTENPYYLSFLLFDLLMIAFYFSYLINIAMFLIVFMELLLLIAAYFPNLWASIDTQQIFWLICIISFFVIISLIQTIYLYKSERSIERKNAHLEQAFESKEGYLKLFFENAKDSIAVFDSNNRIMNANPAFEKLYGWTLEECIGKEIPLVPPDQYEQSKQRIQNILDGKTFELFQTKDMRKDGTVFDAEVTLSPILDGEGNVIARSVITRDISYRKEAEKLKIQSEKLQMAGEIAAGVAHEVRNPLSVISGFIQMMNEDPNSPYKFYMNLIETEIERINLIISEFLVLSKPHAHELKPFDFEKTMRDILILFAPELGLKNISLVENWHADNLYVLGDSNQIKQVLINILKNAVEAIEAEGQIELTVEKEQQHVVIKIADDGIGMTKEVVENIFKPFYTTKEKGTGLGMMITQKIINDHHGEINIESAYGQGTTFIISLPLTSKADDPLPTL